MKTVTITAILDMETEFEVVITTDAYIGSAEARKIVRVLRPNAYNIEIEKLEYIT